MNDRRKILELFEDQADFVNEKVTNGIETYRKGNGTLRIVDKDGNRSKQRIEAPSPEIVSDTLKSRNYYIVSIKEESIFDVIQPKKRWFICPYIWLCGLSCQ